MNISQFKKLLTGYLKNNLSGRDEQLIQRWYQSFGESEEGVPGLKDAQEEERLRNDLLHRIQSMTQEKKKSSPFLSWGRAAAAIFILLSAGTIFFLTNRVAEEDNRIAAVPSAAYQTIRSGDVQMKKVFLPDSSVVFLNANSVIRFPQNFSKSERLFYLEEGEAFFEVKKDKSRPFVIHVNELKVQVLGTSFNINAYKELKDIKVTVSTGRVSVRDEASTSEILTVDQQLTYNKLSRKAERSTAKSQNSKDWINGNVILENAGFEELAQAMLNVYGEKLYTDRVNKNKYKYNLTIRSTRPLAETMGLICAIHNNKYRRTGDGILIQ